MGKIIGGLNIMDKGFSEKVVCDNRVMTHQRPEEAASASESSESELSDMMNYSSSSTTSTTSASAMSEMSLGSDRTDSEDRGVEDKGCQTDSVPVIRENITGQQRGRYEARQGSIFCNAIFIKIN